MDKTATDIWLFGKPRPDLTVDETMDEWKQRYVAVSQHSKASDKTVAQSDADYLRGWFAAVRRCNAEITAIWGADLVTTQMALDKLLEIKALDSGDQNSIARAHLEGWNAALDEMSECISHRRQNSIPDAKP